MTATDADDPFLSLLPGRVRHPAPNPAGLWEWYGHSIKRDFPQDQQLIRDAAGRSVKHGTFPSLPYYAIIDASRPKKPKLLLVSDGGLRAELKLIDHSEKVVRGENAAGALGTYLGAKFSISFDDSYWSKLLGAEEWNALKGKFDNPTLSYNLQDFDKNQPEGIIVISGTPAEFTYLPSGPKNESKHYVRSLPRAPNVGRNDQASGSVFVHKIYGFYLFLRAWDVRKMDLIDCNFQRTGNAAVLFQEPSGDLSNFLQMGENINVPYGWVYASYAGGEQHLSNSVVSSSADVANGMQRATGFHISGSLGVDVGVVATSADFSVAENSELKTKIREVKSQEKTYLEKTTLQTAEAFVLDKRNVTLANKFTAQVDALRQQVLNAKDGKLEERVIQSFFENWGTHYVNAGITGAKGRLVTNMSQSALTETIATEQNAQQKWEVGASLHVMGGMVKAEAKGGAQSYLGTDIEKQKATIFKNEDTYVVTYGGATSDGGVPAPGARIPVLVDLRPISDLFGVPFYNDEPTAILLHDQIAAAGLKYLFKPQGEISVVEGLGYRKMTFDPLKIEVATPKSNVELVVEVPAGPAPVLEWTTLARVQNWFLRLPGNYGPGYKPGTEAVLMPPRIKGLYLNPEKLRDPANWMVRLVFPYEPCLRRAGHLAWPPPDPARSKWWHLQEIDKRVGRNRANAREQTVELPAVSGSTVVLSPNMQWPNQVIGGVDLLFNPDVQLSNHEPLVPGRFFEPGPQASGFWWDLRGPANGGPTTFGPLTIFLQDLTLSGTGTSPLQFPIKVTISGKIEQTTVNELLSFNL